MKKRVAIAVFLILLVVVASMVYIGQKRSRDAEQYYSGTIETTDSNLSFQTSGRVLRVLVQEGDNVHKGQVLAELDAAELQSRQAQAQANLDRSLKSEAQFKSALAISEGALPEEVKQAEANLRAARDTLAYAKRNRDRYEELYRKRVVSERQWDNVRLNDETAQARLDESEAILRQAKSNLKKIDSTRRDLEAATAQVQAAKAALSQAVIQTSYTQLICTIEGILTSRQVEPGEVVTPGREVLTVSDLARVDLKIYVDETQIGTAKPGQKVDVKVDTFPSKVFAGSVSFVSPEAEFTPKIIQTHKERVKLVYLVKISIPNPGLELKSGMPADAWLR
ncbi:MAG: efflux RND transporter periplasmic adaptor subunit [Syntrophales bacterium]|jgi:HlyD family secretion protein